MNRTESAFDEIGLVANGAKPVVYGDESDWQEMTDDRRPYFQIAQSKSGKFDWTTESEWRVVGELDLSRLPADAAVVFVPTMEEAIHLSRISRWPVTTVDRER